MKKEKEIKEIEDRCNSLLEGKAIFITTASVSKLQVTSHRIMRLSYLLHLTDMWRREFEKYNKSHFLVRWYHKICIRGIEKQMNKIPK